MLLAWAGDKYVNRPAASPSEVKVVRVVDGDTIVVRRGKEREKVRVLLVDTPETVKPGVKPQCYGRKASAFTDRMVDRRRVTLKYDRELRDRYGRTLAYVELGDRDLGAELVAAGLARVKVYPPNKARARQYKRLERKARQARVGLWGRCEN